jgi:hypothetical protein
MMPTIPTLRRSLSRLAIVGASALSLLACQTDSDPSDPAGNSPQGVRMQFSDDLTYRRPDSASWAFQGQTGAATLSTKPGSDVHTASFQVSSTPGADTVKLSCWRHGLRVYVLPGVGSGDLTVVSDRIVRDSLAWKVLERHEQDAVEDGGFFGRSAQGVRRTYARMLVGRDNQVAGYPARLPVGMDSAALVDDICVALARARKPFDSLYTPDFLGGDRASWVSIVQARVVSGLLSSMDSLTLFPPPAVPSVVVLEPSESDTIRLPFPQAALHVVARVRHPSKIKPETFMIGGAKAKQDDDSTWSADVAVLPTGTPVVVAVQVDGPVGIVEAKPIVVVRAKDLEAPRVSPLEGTVGRELVGDTEVSVVVNWKVTDNHRVAKVEIAGTPAERADGGDVWFRSVSIKEGDNRIVVRAWDSTGNESSDSIQIRMVPDKTAPMVVPKFGASIQVGAAVAEYELVWAVSDNSGAFKATLDGKPIACVDGICKATVPLVAGSNAFTLDVVDAAGLATRHQATIVRDDETAPTLTPVEPAVAGGVVLLGVGQTSALVKWKAHDDVGPVECTVNGQVVPGDASGSYSMSIDMTGKEGDSVVTIVAKDKAGNVSDTAIFLIRRADAVKPGISLVGPSKDTTVADSISSLAVKFTATDNVGLASVTVNGVAVTISGTTGYTKVLPLVHGVNTVTIVAKDAAGNDSTKVLKITRQDQTKPLISVYSGVVKGSFPAGTASTSLAWKVTDNVAVTSVLVDGVAVSFPSGLVSRTFALVPGRNVFVIVAKDAAGNVAMDTAVYVVAAGATAARIAAGGYFGLHLDDAGTVTSWGREFVLPSGLGVVKEIAAAGRLALFLKADGSVVSVGDGAFPAPAQPALSGVKHVFAGTFGTDDQNGIAILEDDRWVLWGYSTAHAYVDSARVNAPKAIKVAVGGGFIIVHRPDSTAVSWKTAGGATVRTEHGLVKTVTGSYSDGAVLRNDGTIETVVAVNSTWTGATGIKLLDAGFAQSVGVNLAGAPVTWGGVAHGQGNVPTPFPTDVVAVASGYRWNLALTSTGKLVAWGQVGSIEVPAAIKWVAP